MIRVKLSQANVSRVIKFENLVNYDKSKTINGDLNASYKFENLVNYDKSKTLFDF